LGEYIIEERERELDMGGERMYLREHQHENGWTIDQSKEHPFALPFGRDSSSQIDIAIFSNT
jgi:hypothetical protein